MSQLTKVVCDNNGCGKEITDLDDRIQLNIVHRAHIHHGNELPSYLELVALDFCSIECVDRAVPDLASLLSKQREDEIAKYSTEDVVDGPSPLQPSLASKEDVSDLRDASTER